MLKVKNLKKTFGAVTAVDNVSFNINAGEIYSLIGPNGSGKTTIVKIIAGLLQASQGEVEIGHNNINTKTEEAKSITGYIPDDPVIWPNLSGEEYLDFTGALYNIDEIERQKRIQELLGLFNLKGVEKSYFQDYSRGNKQKFTIMSALLHRPKLLLIDEPIVGLDPVSAELMQAELKKFANAGGAVLLVTHTLDVAKKISNRIGILKKGRLITSGSYHDLANEAKTNDNENLNNIYKILTR
ncbi:MAG: ABC transporter ATP-binding protein [Patescibacteria group bacterium]|nr:ABC transporter ATP-binding protein [Patescibacteria group bacterium]